LIPLILGALLFFLRPVELAAQEARPDTLEAEQLIEVEPIEVWYSRVKEQADRVESIQVFTAEEMRNDDEISPYEFFKRVPGINVVQGHAIGFGLRNPVAGRIQIRGIGRKAGPVDFETRGVLLLMDGVPDFSVTHGHPLPDMFSRSYVDEIEVIKGPSSVRYGWAQAGAILMRSRDPIRMGSSGYLAASGGAFGSTQDLADYDYRWQNGFVQASGALRRTDGHRPNSETDAADGRIRLAQEVTPGLNVVGSFRGGTNEWEIPGPVGGEPGVGGENDWWVGDIGARGEAGMWDITAKAWAFDAEVKFDDDQEEPNEAWGGRVKAEAAAWQGGTLLLGTDLMYYRIGRGREEVVKIEPQTEVAPYVWVRHELGRWIVTGGARYTDNEQFGEDFSPEAGVVFKPVPASAIRVHVSHGFRAPNPFEFAFTANSEDLDATDLWQYELGLNQKIGQSVTFDARLLTGWWFGLAGVAMDLENDTALVPQKTLDVWGGWERGPFRISLDGRWAVDRFQQDDEQVPLDDYFVVDLRTQYRFPTGLGFRFEIENLFDDEYELFQDWPMPGIAAYGGIDYVF
jgi:outer membrane receptor protein involved in Fe transport